MEAAVDYSRKWYVLIAVGLSIFLGTIDGSIVNLALPTLVRELDTNFASVQWVVLIYLLGLTTLMPGVGRVADIVGKKQIYILGFIGFIIGSALCGLAPTVWWLVGFRLVQAVGAAMMIGLGPALVTDAFPPNERGRALGWAGLAVSLGVVTGPLVGGVIIDLLSWHWIFYVNVPIGIIATVFAVRFVPAVPPPGGQTFDYAGALTLFLGLLALMLALTLGQERGFGDPAILALFLLAAVLFPLFTWLELRAPQPMLDVRLLANRNLSVNLVASFIAFVSVGSVFFLMPFYLENMRGFPISQVGLMQAIVPIMLGFFAPLSGWIADRYGNRPVVAAGLGIVVITYVLLLGLDLQTSVLVFILSFAPLGIGMGIFQSPNNSTIMTSVPSEQRGVASSLLGITRTMGQIAGVAVLGTVWASRVAFYEGAEHAADATQAPLAAQIAGLHDTYIVLMVLSLVAFGLALWDWLGARSPHGVQPAPAAAPTQPARTEEV